MSSGSCLPTVVWYYSMHYLWRNSRFLSYVHSLVQETCETNTIRLSSLSPVRRDGNSLLLGGYQPVGFVYRVWCYPALNFTPFVSRLFMVIYSIADTRWGRQTNTAFVGTRQGGGGSCFTWRPGSTSIQSCYQGNVVERNEVDVCQKKTAAASSHYSPVWEQCVKSASSTQ